MKPTPAFWKASRPAGPFLHQRFEEGVGAEQRARQRAAEWLKDELPGVRLFERVDGEWVERETRRKP